MPKVRWQCNISFVANFICFSAVQKVCKSVKIWQSYREFKGWKIFETQCSLVGCTTECANRRQQQDDQHWSKCRWCHQCHQTYKCQLSENVCKLRDYLSNQIYLDDRISSALAQVCSLWVLFGYISVTLHQSRRVFVGNNGGMLFLVMYKTWLRLLSTTCIRGRYRVRLSDVTLKQTPRAAGSLTLQTLHQTNSFITHTHIER